MKNTSRYIIGGLVVLFACIFCSMGFALFTAPGLQTPFFYQGFWANQPVNPPAPTQEVVAPVEPAAPLSIEEPATAPAQADDNNVVWLIGGRLDDKSVGYEYVSVAESALINKGTPLQPFFEQVTESTFTNILSLTPKHEILNDGVQFVIIGERAYIMPRESTSPVSFWSISWLQYDPQKGVFICQDDAGKPGDWIGACAGESMWVTTSMPVEDLLVSDLFAPWAKAFVSARTSFDGQVLNDKIEVLDTFRQ